MLTSRIAGATNSPKRTTTGNDLSGETSQPIDTKDARTRAQKRFLMCYDETGRVLEASRWANVARSAHYQWLEEDPTYRAMFQAARIKAAQRLEAVRVAHYGLPKLVLYKGEPARIEGKLLYAHKSYSDRLMARLLKALDPGRFNRQREPSHGVDLDNLTKGQKRDLMEWLRVQLQRARAEAEATG
jgi:hypothetical protein